MAFGTTVEKDVAETIDDFQEELKKLAEILGEAYSQDYDNINNGYPYLKENIPIK